MTLNAEQVEEFRAALFSEEGAHDGYKPEWYEFMANFVCDAALLALREQQPVYVVFDGPPGPESCRFVEVETADGKGVSVGKWEQRPDGYWTLGPLYASAPADAKDAERYRWLRDNVEKRFCATANLHYAEGHEGEEGVTVQWFVGPRKEFLDESIDAAMAASGAGK